MERFQLLTGFRAGFTSARDALLLNRVSAVDWNTLRLGTLTPEGGKVANQVRSRLKQAYRSGFLLGFAPESYSLKRTLYQHSIHVQRL